ncbi:MAG: ABC transporter permease [Aestuariivita sp.]|nr:ABC transporter permease [Aestuariivita sp.]
MRLIFRLAIKGLLYERIHLICNAAILASVLVPLMVIFGIKNGVYSALLDRLLNDPTTLRIETTGNVGFSEKDVEIVRSWKLSGFVTAKTRSIFDFVNVRRQGDIQKRTAILVPSGKGDPTLPNNLELGIHDAVLSANLARQLNISVGDPIQIFTQAAERPKQLMLPLKTVAILPDAHAAGRSIFADIAVLDLVEAFYDEYALPDYGITEGRDFSTRVPEFEGMRIFARDLRELAALQSQVEQFFDVRTEAQTAEVTGVLSLNRNLNIALLLNAGIASLGLAAALIFSFWGEVARKRQTIATLALLGIAANRLWLFPVIQAIVSGFVGLIVSFLIFFAAATLAEILFDSELTENSALVVLTSQQIIAIIVTVLLFVICTSYFAARSAFRIDPAEVLRQGAT